MQVSVCPGGLASGYTYFIPQEEHLESQVVTRGYLEGRMVVGMAGRCLHFLPLLSLYLVLSAKTTAASSQWMETGAARKMIRTWFVNQAKSHCMAKIYIADLLISPTN